MDIVWEINLMLWGWILVIGVVAAINKNRPGRGPWQGGQL